MGKYNSHWRKYLFYYNSTFFNWKISLLLGVQPSEFIIYFFDSYQDFIFNLFFYLFGAHLEYLPNKIIINYASYLNVSILKAS